MTVLVTGGAGYIGGKLVESLLARREKVRVFDLRIESAPHLGRIGAELMAGDILDRAAVRPALDGCDRLFHAAALFAMWQPDKRAYYEVNVEGTRNVLETAFEMGIERVVHTSSAVTIGEGRDGLGDEETVHRGYFLSDYERSKYLGEQVALEMSQQGLPLVCVNPTTVYGPGQTTHMTGALIRFLNGRLPAVVDTWLNFVFIDDVVQGHLLAMDRGELGQRYILGGENTSLVQFLSLAAEIAGVKREPRTVPGSLLNGTARVMGALSKVTGRRPWVSPDEARTALHSFIFDTRKAREALGLEFTPLLVGLRETVNWLLE
ncbi:MAG: NAD-dependent dehydratase [Chloroflexi bacterium B3_Chlor]|nr:MAG: NAD-dependent dehydratase [Chloroflexi bacterium B3_Chlor]